MAKLTNIFGDGQVDGYNPDADGDYFQIADYGRDVNYLIEKIAEAIKAISAEPDESFHILYGGEVTEHSAASGTIDISAGVAIGKDADGNVRLITLPAISDQALPVAYYNDLQIWVIGKHEWKLDTTSAPCTRTHKSAAVSYNYMADDNYVGETAFANMVTQTDPNTPTETVVCWGSFKMSAGNVFTALTGRTRVFGATRAASYHYYTTTTAGVIYDLLSPLLPNIGGWITINGHTVYAGSNCTVVTATRTTSSRIFLYTYIPTSGVRIPIQIDDGSSAIHDLVTLVW